MVRTTRAKGPAQQVVEFKDLVVGYAKQETVDPLKTLRPLPRVRLRRAILLAGGVIFLLMALLRGLQQIDVFSKPCEVDGGTWSWVPYIITLVAGVGIVGLFALSLRRAVTQGKANERHPS